MESKFYVLWSAETGVGRKTIAQSMAKLAAQENRSVLLIHLDAVSQTAKDPAGWVPRFQSLSPSMLRNYLSSSLHRFSYLELQTAPSPELTKTLLPLLRNAFELILLEAPVEWSVDMQAILDNADLLLWVARANEVSQAKLSESFEKLASLHFPNAFSQVIYNQVSGSPDYRVTPFLEIAREVPMGMHFQKSIHQLLETLRSRQDLILQRNKPLTSTTVVEDMKNRIKPQLIEAMNSPHSAEEVTQKTLETALAADATLAATREERQQIYTQVMNEVLGLGPLEPLLKDPAISEVMVNGKGAIFIEKKGKLYPTDVTFISDTQIRTVIDRIVAPLGRRVDESMPLCDARLADGSRVNIVLPPLALDGPTITIRKFMAKALNLHELAGLNSLSLEMAEFLKTCVIKRKNIVVAGGTGSGKTTLLNALSGLIPDDERIVTIEDAAELRLQKPHVVRLESRPPNAEGEGAIPIRRLVINALRMRPDRIVVGECRGGEALDMLQAMNTGHDGSLTTVHANSPRDALRRLETLVLMAGMDLPVRVVREQIQSAVDLLIQQSRLPDGSRKIISITEVTGMEGDTLTTQELFRYRGTFEKTGLMPMEASA